MTALPPPGETGASRSHTRQGTYSRPLVVSISHSSASRVCQARGALGVGTGSSTWRNTKPRGLPLRPTRGARPLRAEGLGDPGMRPGQLGHRCLLLVSVSNSPPPPAVQGQHPGRCRCEGPGKRNAAPGGTLACAPEHRLRCSGHPLTQKPSVASGRAHVRWPSPSGALPDLGGRRSRYSPAQGPRRHPRRTIPTGQSERGSPEMRWGHPDHHSRPPGPRDLLRGENAKTGSVLF